MSICFYHIYFRPKISAACFKISFSIFNCWFSLRSFISSSCSGVLLSFSWKEPELSACFTHLSNREVEISYSLQMSHLRFPAWYKSTSCCLNASVYFLGFLLCFFFSHNNLLLYLLLLYYMTLKNLSSLL